MRDVVDQGCCFMSPRSDAPPRPPPRVGVVSAHYYRSYLGPSLRAAAGLAQAAGAEAFVAVTNHPALIDELPCAFARLGLPRVEHVVHDNTGYEFGAYQAGLDRLAPLDLDWVLILNDTYALHRAFTSVHRRHLLEVLARPADDSASLAAGEVETYGRSFAILGARTHRWLSTSVFALNRVALRALGGRVYRPELDALVPGGPDVDRFFAPALDGALARHVAAWLLVPRGPDTWYGAAVPDAANAARLAAKARSILQEKHLSALLEEASTWFFDLRGSGPRDRVQRRLERLVFDARCALGVGVPRTRGR
jgi:hypothetical protein